MLDVPRLAKTIYASCILHNICMSMNDDIIENIPRSRLSELIAEEDNVVDDVNDVGFEPALPQQQQRRSTGNADEEHPDNSDADSEEDENDDNAETNTGNRSRSERTIRAQRRQRGANRRNEIKNNLLGLSTND